MFLCETILSLCSKDSSVPTKWKVQGVHATSACVNERGEKNKEKFPS